jgi:predicted AlkP superfamily phosphohydrolase/phosphomutase
MNNYNKPKVLVIGVDGATFDVVQPAINNGYLSNFKALSEDGVYGKLESTIPPITAPAWASFQTGKNPGQHGIFDWLVKDDYNYSLKPINANFVKHKTLWEIISEQGKKVGIVNVPITFPPKKVNGFLISGMLTPSKNSEFTYPLRLKSEIKDKFNDYEIMPGQRFNPHKVNNWLKGLKNMLIKRKKMAMYLMGKYDWDFFMVHFFATDIVQHRMWHTVNEKNNPILNIYEEVNKAIGEIINSVSQETAVFIISDHGFGPLYYNIYLNNWLLKEGYLKLKNNFSTKFKKLMYTMNITPATIYKLLGKIGLLGAGLKLNKGQRYNLLSNFFLSSSNIDWKHTKAYSYGNIGQIYINTQGRESSGCVNSKQKAKLIDEIVAKLNDMINPFTGEHLFDKIYRKEEIYSGSELHNSPEIILLPKNIETMAVGVSEFISNKIIEPSFAFKGSHRLEGLLIAKARDFKKNTEIKNARIIDLFPTILYSMGLAIPDDIDGKVLKNIFTDNFLNQNKENYISYEKTETYFGKECFDEKERLQIRKRLKALGYI